MNMIFRCFLAAVLGAAGAADLEPRAPAAFKKPAKPAAARSHDKIYEQLDLLVDVLDLIEENYVEEPDLRKLIYGAAAGAARSLDPFSQFMEPQAHREIQAETEGEFGGIGIRLIMKDDWLTVLTPLPGTPAYRAGLLPNDRIVEINGESAKDLQVADAMELLRGAAGTKVKIAVMRWPAPRAGELGASSGPARGAAEEAGVEKKFELVREVIKIESVEHRRLGDKIGYLRIIEFSARTMDDFRSALRDLSREGLDGLILDLRFNPGGLLTAAVDVASDFLGGNRMIVYTQGRRPDSRQEFRGGLQAPYQDLPLAVLVNEASASGAEIVAGALQDHRRALIVGERTYGKASVQTVIALPDNSALRLTVAHYYTPNGRLIQRDEKKKTGGISPDVEVSASREIEDKIFEQWEMIYEPGKKPRSAGQGEPARDEALERAAALLKSGELVKRLQAAKP